MKIIASQGQDAFLRTLPWPQFCKHRGISSAKSITIVFSCYLQFSLHQAWRSVWTATDTGNIMEATSGKNSRLNIADSGLTIVSGTCRHTTRASFSKARRILLFTNSTQVMDGHFKKGQSIPLASPSSLNKTSARPFSLLQWSAFPELVFCCLLPHLVTFSGKENKSWSLSS